MTVAEVVAEWPDTAALLHALDMICPGCAVAPFCDLTYAAAAHGVPLSDLLAALTAEITRGPAGESHGEPDNAQGRP